MFKDQGFDCSCEPVVKMLWCVVAGSVLEGAAGKGGRGCWKGGREVGGGGGCKGRLNLNCNWPTSTSLRAF